MGAVAEETTSTPKPSTPALTTEQRFNQLKTAIIWDGSLTAGVVIGGIMAYRAKSPWVAATYGLGSIGLSLPLGAAGFVTSAYLMIAALGLAAGGATAATVGVARGVIGVVSGKAKS
jgi:hypothetical protein